MIKLSNAHEFEKFQKFKPVHVKSLTQIVKVMCIDLLYKPTLEY